jgi:hypothetical protein
VTDLLLTGRYLTLTLSIRLDGRLCPVPPQAGRAVPQTALIHLAPGAALSPGEFRPVFAASESQRFRPRALPDYPVARMNLPVRLRACPARSV